MGPFIRPFTTNKALSGPPLHRDRALFPVHPPVGGRVRGWSAPALIAGRNVGAKFGPPRGNISSYAHMCRVSINRIQISPTVRERIKFAVRTEIVVRAAGHVFGSIRDGLERFEQYRVSTSLSRLAAVDDHRDIIVVECINVAPVILHPRHLHHQPHMPVLCGSVG